MDSLLNVQINDRAQSFSVFCKGNELGSIGYSLINSVVELQSIDMADGHDCEADRSLVISAVMETLERMEDTPIRVRNRHISAWLIENPQYYDLMV